MEFIPDKDLSKKVINLAYPVVLGMISRTIMGLVDVAMVGRLGAPQLAATGLGVHLILLFIYSFGTINIGVQAMTSRRYGERKYLSCGNIVHGTVLVISVIGLLGSAAGYLFGSSVFKYLTSDPEVLEYGSSYVSIRFIEMFAIALTGLHRGFFDGIGKTKIYMKSMIVMNLLNIVLNYVLIFGMFGFPRLEVTGAALGSTISSYIGAAMFLSFAFTKEFKEKYSLYKSIKPDLELVKSLFRLSLPTIIQHYIIFAGFLTFLKIVGMISTISLAASNIGINILSVSFMPGFGIGIAAATLVGQNLGAKKPDYAEKMASESLKLGVIFMGFLGILFLIFPGFIMRIFTPDPEIISEGITILRICGVVQFIDAVGIVLSNVLKGAGMTRYIMVADAICIWVIFVPASYLLGLILGFGNAGAWLGMALYVTAFAIVTYIPFKKGVWKEVEV